MKMVALDFLKVSWYLWVIQQNLTESRSVLLTAFEVVQRILSFVGFTLALIGLSYKIFKDCDKK